MLRVPIHTFTVIGMAVRKKTLNLDQTRVDRVRRVLHATSDTEAIHGALDRVIFAEEVTRSMRRVAGKGKGVFRQLDDGPKRRPARST